MFESACRMNGGVMFVLSAGSRALSQREPPQSFFRRNPLFDLSFLFYPDPPLFLSLSLCLSNPLLFLHLSVPLLCFFFPLFDRSLAPIENHTPPPRHFYLIRRRKASGSARTHTHTHTRRIDASTLARARLRISSSFFFFFFRPFFPPLSRLRDQRIRYWQLLRTTAIVQPRAEAAFQESNEQ